MGLGAAALLCFSAALAAQTPEFDADRAWEHLLRQCSFGPRSPGSPGHAACLPYLEKTLREAGGAVSLQPFDAVPIGGKGPVRMTNLIARYGPPGRPLLLGTHWDTRPWADRDPDPKRRREPILGANDGASGVAVLLALAELFGKVPPPIPVEIVLFDGEDGGVDGTTEGWCLGSRHYARRLLPPGPKAAVIVDIVGGKDLTICREEASDRAAKWLNDILFHRSIALGLAGFHDSVCIAVYDDHIPLIERGIPAVDLIDMHYPQWHTLRDVPESCSRESLGQVGALLVDLVYGGTLH